VRQIPYGRNLGFLDPEEVRGLFNFIAELVNAERSWYSRGTSPQTSVWLRIGCVP
jgi:hypothetical protein